MQKNGMVNPFIIHHTLKFLGLLPHKQKKQKKWLKGKKGLHPAVGENLAKWEQSENLS